MLSIPRKHESGYTTALYSTAVYRRILLCIGTVLLYIGGTDCAHARACRIRYICSSICAILESIFGVLRTCSIRYICSVRKHESGTLLQATGVHTLTYADVC